MNATKADIHNRYAIYWGITFAVCLIAGLSTLLFDPFPFLHGYVLDICGPAWTYILVRGLSREYSEHRWYRIFTPVTTFTIIVVVLYSIEGAQYLKLYNGWYDPWDLAAYVALVLPMFVLDIVQKKIVAH